MCSKKFNEMNLQLLELRFGVTMSKPSPNREIRNLEYTKQQPPVSTSS